MIAAHVEFIAPASKTYVPARVLAALDPQDATEVDYVAERDAGIPAEQRGRWRVTEDTMTISGPRKKDPVLGLRRVFVHFHRLGTRRQGRTGEETRPSPRRPGPTDPGAGQPPLSDTEGPNGSPRSAAPAGSPPTYAPRPVRIRPPANPPWPGPSTRPRSTPRPPPTGGTRC